MVAAVIDDAARLPGCPRPQDVNRAQSLSDPRLKEERSMVMNEKRAGDEPVTLDTRPHLDSDITRRDVLLGSAAAIMTASVPWGAVAQSNGASAGSSNHIGDTKLNTTTTKDGATI